MKAQKRLGFDLLRINVEHEYERGLRDVSWDLGCDDDNGRAVAWRMVTQPQFVCASLHRKSARHTWPTWPRSVAIDRTRNLWAVGGGNREPAEGFWESLAMLVLRVGAEQKVTMAASVPWFFFFFGVKRISFMYDTLDEESGVLAKCYRMFALIYVFFVYAEFQGWEELAWLG